MSSGYIDYNHTNYTLNSSYIEPRFWNWFASLLIPIPIPIVPTVNMIMVAMGTAFSQGCGAVAGCACNTRKATLDFSNQKISVSNMPLCLALSVGHSQSSATVGYTQEQIFSDNIFTDYNTIAINIPNIFSVNFINPVQNMMSENCNDRRSGFNFYTKLSSIKNEYIDRYIGTVKIYVSSPIFTRLAIINDNCMGKRRHVHSTDDGSSTHWENNPDSSSDTAKRVTQASLDAEEQQHREFRKCNSYIYEIQNRSRCKTCWLAESKNMWSHTIDSSYYDWFIPNHNARGFLTKRSSRQWSNPSTRYFTPDNGETNRKIASRLVYLGIDLEQPKPFDVFFTFNNVQVNVTTVIGTN